MGLLSEHERYFFWTVNIVHYIGHRLEESWVNTGVIYMLCVSLSCVHKTTSRVRFLAMSPLSKVHGERKYSVEVKTPATLVVQKHNTFWFMSSALMFFLTIVLKDKLKNYFLGANVKIIY